MLACALEMQPIPEEYRKPIEKKNPTHNHQINGCHVTHMCEDIEKNQFCHQAWDAAT